MKTPKDQPALEFGEPEPVHMCHATACGTEVPPRLFMCSYHWGQLPKPYRDKIWKHYREGQEIDKKPSKAYLKAAQEAIDYMAANEGYEKERANE